MRRSICTGAGRQRKAVFAHSAPALLHNLNNRNGKTCWKVKQATVFASDVECAENTKVMTMKKRTNNWLGLLTLAVLLPVAGPAQAGLFSISPEKERNLGEDAAREIDTQARIVTGPVADWVQSVGERLAAVSDKQFQYSFKVIDSKEINAFALPGGHVYVFTGIRKVAQTDDELAAILAHEITHAEQRHYAKQYGKASKRGALLSILTLAVGMPNIAQQAIGLLDFAMTQKYSRTHETEADLLGMERMKRAGFNPQGMVNLLERLAKEDKSGGTIDNWFGDHPDSDRRIERARNQLKALSGGAPSPTAVAPIKP